MMSWTAASRVASTTNRSGTVGFQNVRFSRTVASNSCGCWSTMPTESEKISTGMSSSGCPSNRISPDHGRYTPATSSDSEVLPDPDGPTTATRSPGLMVRLKFRINGGLWR